MRNMAKSPPPEQWAGVQFTCKIGAAVAAHLVAGTKAYNDCTRTRLWFQPCCTRCMLPWKTHEKEKVKAWWGTCIGYYNTADSVQHESANENKHVDGTVVRPVNRRSSTARSSTVAGNSSTVVDASESTTDGELNRRQSKYGDRIKPQETGRMGKDRQAEWTTDKYILKAGDPSPQPQRRRSANLLNARHSWATHRKHSVIMTVPNHPVDHHNPVPTPTTVVVAGGGRRSAPVGRLQRRRGGRRARGRRQRRQEN